MAKDQAFFRESRQAGRQTAVTMQQCDSKVTADGMFRYVLQTQLRCRLGEMRRAAARRFCETTKTDQVRKQADDVCLTDDESQLEKPTTSWRVKQLMESELEEADGCLICLKTNERKKKSVANTIGSNCFTSLSYQKRLLHTAHCVLCCAVLHLCLQCY